MSKRKYLSGNNLPQVISGAVYITGRTQGSLTIGAAAAQTPITTGGIYAMSSTIDCHIAVEADSTAALAVLPTTGFPLFSGGQLDVHVDDNHHLGGIAGGSGTITFFKID